MENGKAGHDEWLAKLPSRVENGKAGRDGWEAKLPQKVENEFLERDGVTREMMTNVLGISGISSASLLIKGEYM